jgi:hypothetical protein
MTFAVDRSPKLNDDGFLPTLPQPLYIAPAARVRQKLALTLTAVYFLIGMGHLNMVRETPAQRRTLPNPVFFLSRLCQDLRR